MLSDWLTTFDFLAGAPAAYAVVVLAVALSIVEDTRLVLALLAVQYVALGIMLGELFVPGLAFSKVILGLFVCLSLYVTLRQIDAWPGDSTQVYQPWRLATAAAVVLLAAVAAWLTAAGAFYFLFATYALALLGLFRFASTTRPIFIGVGLLMLLSGFELFYLLGNTSRLLLGLFAVGNLLIVTVVAYLAQLRAFTYTTTT